MADVRSLLRQQRAARRIEHPHAAYSDAGKLLCTLCREVVKADSLWESHLKGEEHRRRQKALSDKRQREPQQTVEKQPEDEDAPHDAPEDDPQDNNTDRAPSQKRKLQDDSPDSDSDPHEDPSRRKRSRADLLDSVSSTSSTSKDKLQEAAQTPPTLARRSSTTPSHGIEIQIPSRPATPARRDGSSSSTPGAAATTVQQPAGKTLPSRQATTLLAAATASSTPSTTAQQAVDDAEWAAFEADIAAAANVPAAASDAVISALPMSAAESAAAAAGPAAVGEPADTSLADDREDAARAWEDEFDDMHALEARVQRLKEQREVLAQARKRSLSQAGEAGDAKRLRSLGKENTATENGEEAAEDEESSDEDEDDWDGFRFRTAA